MKFISGLQNCHLLGLYSLVLEDRVSDSVGMRRVFYAGRDCEMGLWEGNDFTLKPHNHRQDIRLTKLFGNVANLTLDFGRDDLLLWRYRFTSALLTGEFSVEREEDQYCGLHSPNLLDKPLDLRWSDVHTVVAAPYSAWMVEEFAKAPAGIERCYSRSANLTLNSFGLYLPMMPLHLQQITEEVRERMGR